MGAIPALLVILVGAGLGEALARALKWRWPIWIRAILSVVVFYGLFAGAAMVLGALTPDEIERAPGYVDQVLQGVIGASAVGAALFFWRLKPAKIEPMMVGMCLALLVAAPVWSHSCEIDGDTAVCPSGMVLKKDENGRWRDVADGVEVMLGYIPGSQNAKDAAESSPRLRTTCTTIGDTTFCN